MSTTNLALSQEIVVPLDPPVAFVTSHLLAGQRAPSTITRYLVHFEDYLAFGGSVALDAATFARWRQQLVEEGYSANTINLRLSAVRSVLDAAAEQGYIDQATADAFRRVKGVRKRALKERRSKTARVSITAAQMRQICDMPDPTTPIGRMHRALLASLAGSGLRIGELVALQRHQIQWRVQPTGQRGWAIVSMGKNEDEEVIKPLTDEAVTRIDLWLASRPVQSAYIFTGFSGKYGRGPRTTPLAPSSAWAIVRRYALEAGVAHVKPHDFRRFVGTQLAARDIRLAQKVLGHKRIETTAQHYVLDDEPLGATEGLY